MTPTDEQIEWWRRQAGHELTVAESLIRDGHYSDAVVACQQAAELHLKLLYMKREASAAPPWHDLTELGRAVRCPAEMLDPLGELTEDYTRARYPDAAMGTPYELYDADDAQQALHTASAVAEWVLQQLGGH